MRVYLLISDHGETDDLEGIFTTEENAKEHWKNQNNLEYVQESYIIQSIELDWPHSDKVIWRAELEKWKKPEDRVK